MSVTYKDIDNGLIDLIIYFADISHYNFKLYFFIFIMVLGIEPRVLSMLRGCSTVTYTPSPYNLNFLGLL
jgi:hypothetical protein